MPFLTPEQESLIRQHITSDPSLLNKIYKSKKSEYYFKSVNHSLAEEYIDDGWEEYTDPLKTKTKIRKEKSSDVKFEDQVWCLMYELGFTTLNINRELRLPFGGDPDDSQQIDVYASDGETVLIFECKSSRRTKKVDYKAEFTSLSLKIDGFSKSVKQLESRSTRLKFIWATRNIRLDVEHADFRRLIKSGAFYFNDNTFDYLTSLIKNYKAAAKFQFLGIIFKNQLINNESVVVPAIEGKMGNLTYYMFSIEPSLLLKMGFVLHRTRANEAEMPTYQRLLIPSRLKHITKYIDEGGYFPNSIILNFTTKKNKVNFVPAGRSKSSISKIGTLEIPNAYAIAYIIDGQHRLYGYANSQYLATNTIPVVAFKDLSSVEQLRIFMDINENQKAVSPNLRYTLEEDLFWDSPRADSRIKALRSSIIRYMGLDSSSPLYNRITIGEDKAEFQVKPFTVSLTRCGLLPKARGNKFIPETTSHCMYDVNNLDHQKEMDKTRKRVVTFLSSCYDIMDTGLDEEIHKSYDLIFSNRGHYAFIMLMGELNEFIINEHEEINQFSRNNKRIEVASEYLNTLISGLKKLDDSILERELTTLGDAAKTSWLRLFEDILNKQYPKFEPQELIHWRERQDEELQERGRKVGTEIEKFMKKNVLETIQALYGKNWELEINSIKRECMKRAEEENERNYKEGIENARHAVWTEMFNINDYKSIISKYWNKITDRVDSDFETFSKQFSVDIGEGLGSKAKSMKWISRFNSYRNLWAHEGTKEKRLNKNEVEFLERVHRKLNV